MNRFKNLPIQQKLLVMTLLICGAVLCVALAALFAFQVLNFRSNFQRDTATLAVVIANNSTAAMAFKDDQAAAEVIGALQAEPRILSASLALPDGSAFAHFGAPENSQARAQFPGVGRNSFVDGQLLVTQPVTLKGERVGILYLRSDYQRVFQQLLRFYGLIVTGIIVVSCALAVFLSGRLGRGITQPILELSRTAEFVGEKKDYSVRIAVTSRGDELGKLTLSFNEMLGRIQTQDAALSFSQQKMEALIHSIDGIVWERRPDTFQFTFISRQSEEILGYNPDDWLRTPEFLEKKYYPADAAKAIQTLKDMSARGLPYSFEFRVLAADGRAVWLRESGTVLTENGRPVAMRGIFQDVTQQKLNAEELDRLNRQLMDTSRRAGMAEVATGVLHNVGNILNSVSVSSTLVSERLRDSNIGDFCRATEMMREQNGHLGEFLTSHPKGKLIPEFLGAVADEMAGQQTELISEMDSVSKNIEHIKEIVAMQQSYAKVSGVYENLSVVGLVEDALRMNTAAFDRHHITLIREFDEQVPIVCVDRHKVLQILINLLRNAKHAMDDRKDQEKKMGIAIEMASLTSVRIIVTDNGVGIARENLSKVFNHGFTTKKDGHGFGLHSGANAAKEMGGTLTASSDGPGKGATFTLELPIMASRKEPAMATEKTS